SILPSSIRQPLPIEIVDQATSVFSADGMPPDPDHVYRTPPLAIATWQREQGGKWGNTLHVKVPATRFPFLRLGLAGQAGPERHSMTIVHQRGRPPVKLPSTRPLHNWTSVTVRAPEGPFTIEAETPSFDTWWGFSAPTEAGPLSGRVDLIHRLKYVMLALG